MIVFHAPDHQGHAPEYEWERGVRVPCRETPERVRIVCRELEASGHQLRMPTHDSAPFLPRVHAPRYLAFLASMWEQWVALDPANAEIMPSPAVWPVRTLRSDIEPENFTARLGLYSMDNETPLAAGTWTAAKAAADAAVSGAALLGAGARSAFCATRPPGHHAGSDFMGGYCFLNHAAIAAEALRAGGCDRVAILDIDYHHGNGTQSIFSAREDVLTVSIHGDPRTEYPFYLGYEDETREGPGAGFNRNYPLPAGTGFETWFATLEAALARVKEHHPGALIVSLGLDTYAGDPISTFQLQTEDYPTVGARLRDAGLPTLFILEGGYAVADLGRNAAAVLQGFEVG